MAYDESLAKRIRAVLGADDRVSEKKMFGGVAFLLDGKMFCGIVKDDLMVRIGLDRYEEALKKAGTRPMDFTGRPMKGYVYVEPRGYSSAKAMKQWVSWASEFVATLEAKPKRARTAKPRAARVPRARK